MKAPKSLPEDLLSVDLAADFGVLELPEITASMKPESLQPGIWSTAVTANIREGISLDAGHVLGSTDKIAAAVFAPSSGADSHLWSGEVGWMRNGLLSGRAKIGIKEGGETLPYSIVSLNWDRGINQPDNCFVELYHFGSSTYRLSILSAIDLSFRFREGSWLINTKIEGGISRTENNTEGSARGVLAIGLNSHGLRNAIGVDVTYDDSNKIRTMPFLDFNWRPDDNISIFANAEFVMRYPGNLGTVFFRERMNAFEAQIPIQSKYRLGIAQAEKKRLSYLLEISYAEGRFCEMKNGIIVSRNDRRMLGLASIGYAFGSQRISFSGKLGFPLSEFIDIWESKIELTARRLSYYIFGSSQDAVLSEFSGGFRGEEAIVGLGLNWEIDNSWRADIFAYTGVTWDKPSLELTLIWRSAGAADG